MNHVRRLSAISEFDPVPRTSKSFLMLIFVAGLLVGGIVSFYINFQDINSLSGKIALLESQVSKLEGIQSGSADSYNVTIYQNTTALSEIHASLRDSVVMVQGTTSEGDIQGSGFVYNFSGLYLIITNYHVIHETDNLSVTFADGNGYPAKVLGSDPYVDLAVLNATAPPAEFKPVEIVSSSNLRVGEQVIAIGNPYGLVGSLTTGVVSALGRTLVEQEFAGSFSIANVIQTSTPINPGNSGGPLLNLAGKVIGITTAIVYDSQGLGFAIPSNAILREISALVNTGTYEGHSFMGVAGQDMNYVLAQELGYEVTYGWRILEVRVGDPSDGVLRLDDIIIAMNGSVIRNGDDLSSYLAEYTMPGDQLSLTVVRDNSEIELSLILGTRPPPPV